MIRKVFGGLSGHTQSLTKIRWTEQPEIPIRKEKKRRLKSYIIFLQRSVTVNRFTDYNGMHFQINQIIHLTRSYSPTLSFFVYCRMQIEWKGKTLWSTTNKFIWIPSVFRKNKIFAFPWYSKSVKWKSFMGFNWQIYGANFGDFVILFILWFSAQITEQFLISCRLRSYTAHDSFRLLNAHVIRLLSCYSDSVEDDWLSCIIYSKWRHETKQFTKIQFSIARMQIRLPPCAVILDLDTFTDIHYF